MEETTPNALMPFGVFDDSRFATLAVENSERYQNAAPFPHIVFDDFLAPQVARGVAQACSEPEHINWIVRDHQHSLKRYQHDETMLPPLIRQMLREFNSRQFILFLETLTGIDNLLPDPYFTGGGLHLSSRGSFLKIHADFNWHHKLQAHRRVNVLFYLNEGWLEEWGGALEFWDKNISQAVTFYYPIFNRAIIFNTNEDSNHGHPHPLACPANIYRRSLNLYYYTTRRDEAEIHEPHFTLYKTQASSFATGLGEEYRKSATTNVD
jgi:hypothetical protein